MVKLAKCGILLQTACHNSKGQNGVTITSNSQPPMVLLSTHTCTLAHRHTKVHTQWCSTLLSPGLTAWLGLSLQKAGLSVSEKFSSHSSEGQEHYLHLHLCQPPPPSLQPFLLSLSSSLGNVWLTGRHVRAGEQRDWQYIIYNTSSLCLRVCFDFSILILDMNIKRVFRRL